MVTRLALLIIGCCITFGCSSNPTKNSVSIGIGGENFHLELVVDDQSRAQGLMNRTHLGSDEGMLFIFPFAEERSFWMKNCLIDIDLIFLDSRGTVTAVHSMPLEPPRGANETIIQYENRLLHYWSNGPARFAIELSSGSFKRLGVHVNDRITLDLPTLKRLAR